MKHYPNIQKAPTDWCQYIGHSADGRSWEIFGQSGNWSARANVTRQGSESLLLGFERLDEISAELAAIK